MRTIFFIIQKEFRQIFRNKGMLPVIFIMPVVQLLILANAATFEVKNIGVHIIDHDQSAASRLLISKFRAFPNFNIVNTSFAFKSGLDDFGKDRAQLIMTIPPDFEQNFAIDNSGKIQLVVNAINSSAAGIISVYANSIIRDFGRDLSIQNISFSPPAGININYSFWYNPEMNYKTFMVPGILVLLVTMIGMFLAGMNIVREKEIGTIEQINVTPIRKYQFIAGKLIPFWLLALFELALGLSIGKLVFDIPIVGSIVLIFAFAGLYLLAVLGLGLFVSTFTNTQQQAMFISWFIMVIFILMSGLFTPIESMPAWAQTITKFNPVAYFVEVMRMVMLKGSGVMDIKHHIFMLAIYALTILSLAVWRYRKVA